MGNGIRTRDGIPERYKWRLSDIFPSIQDWEEGFAALQQMIASMPALERSLTPEKGSILGALRAVCALNMQMEALYAYSRMLRDEDSREAQPQAMSDRAMTLAVGAEVAGSFLRPALLAMPEGLLRDCAADPAFAEYDRVLEHILRSRPHTLAAGQEALLAQAGEIGDAPVNIYTLLTEADLTFPAIAGEDGVPQEVNDARLSTLLQSRDPRVRKDAYEAVLGGYGGLGNTFATIYSSSVKKDIFIAKARRFPSAVEASLFESEIPVSVYDALLTAVDERLPALNRYLALKRKALGLRELHMWDLYVNTAKEFELRQTYEEAYAMVVEALAPLGDDYIDVLAGARDRGWVDVYENAGKHHGMYCWGCYGAHPYVLLNFDGTLDSASAIAHEMGHAMHRFYSCQAQPFAKAEYTTFAAEVASTVNEVLLSCYLLEKYPDAAAQQSLLGMLLEQYRTTVFRQALFAAFEWETHAMQEAGVSLTKEALCDLFYTLNVKYYGMGCAVDEIVRYEWMRIPHFYQAFYVYQYATGFCAAVCVARKILKEGRPAVEGYRKFLQSGGAVPPLEALKLVGVDMETPGPVREALDWFEELVGRFEGGG